MKTSLRSLIAATMVVLGFAGHSFAAQQCLVIGDSLTKEYEVEFPVLYPENRDAWDARNWIEILHQQRNAWFDLSTFSVFPDYRVTGHRLNWAFPGATTQEMRDKLSSSSWFDKQWQSTLKAQIKTEAERVVIFAGGNDVDAYYGRIYNGSTSASYTNRTRDNLMWIVDWVRAQRSSIPIVLVSVPHVGCAPDVQREFPTNGVKTARVSNALVTLNAQLTALAKTRGIAFAPGVFDLTRNIITQKFVIGGVEINRGTDDDCDPHYAFSGDGFHPNTPLQAKIAQIVLDTFRAKWPTPAITPLTDAQILHDVLGVTP